MDDLQCLTASQGVSLYRLVDLGYLTPAQVDELITRLVRERLIKAQEYLRQQALAAVSDAELLLTACREELRNRGVSLRSCEN